MTELAEFQTYRDRTTPMFVETLGSDELASIVEDSIAQKCYHRAKEASMSIETPLIKHMYISLTRHIINNIDPESYVGNRSLKNRLIGGEIDPAKIVDMSPQELFPEHWDKMVQEKKRRDEIQYSSTTQAMTDAYKCRKCGSRKITYYDLQIRSADEGFTTFYTCLGCGCKWKKN